VKLIENFKKLDYIKINDEENVSPKPIVDCSLGVSPFGYSKKINKHSIIDKTNIQNYPPFPYTELKDNIVQYWSDVQLLSRKNIHVCSGTMLIVDSINTLFIDKGDKVLGYSPQFPEYVNSVRVRGGVYDASPLKKENNFKFIAGDLIAKMRKKKYKMIYIDNPNNPTGQIIDIKSIESVVSETFRLGVCVIVDEAYGDYMCKENSAITLLGKYDNLFVTRTFSKAYALAGMRIGYVVASEELSGYYSIIDDLLLNPIGLEAATISLMDQTFLEEVITITASVKENILSSFNKLKVMGTSNQVPIFTLVHPNPDVNLADLLLDNGVLATSGFDGLGINAVRIRIPKDLNPLLTIISKIEASIS